MLRKSTAFPKGEPHLSGAYVGKYPCARCGRLQTLSKAQWGAVPDLTLEDFEGLAKAYKAPFLANLPTKDVEGSGFSKEHSRDLFRAGFHAVSELESLFRD
jgi:hypothetical protein